MATAQCFCGIHKLEVTGSFGKVRYCHCSQCRKKSGTAFTANAKVNRSQFSIAGPKDQITEFEQRPGLFHAFCSSCGSPLYARLDAEPDKIRVRMGAFEGDVDVEISSHVWVSSKSTWYDIQDNLTQHEKRFDSTPKCS